jgi:heterodisulfide reductase subunit B
VKIGYYPGCSLESTATEYDLSWKAVAAHVGIELIELPDWNCCGASSAHPVDPVLTVALPARNLVVAEEMGLDELVIPCAACFLRFRDAQKRLKENPALCKEVEETIGKKYKGTTKISHPLSILSQPEIKKKVKQKTVHPLMGLKVVCYYGCYLVRPPETTHIDDPENPMVMDDLIGLTGAETIDWAWKVDCCGAGHALLRPELVDRLVGEILGGAYRTGAHAVVDACPLCQANLEGHQKGPHAPLPIFYFTELLGLAMGLKKEAEGWWNKHLITPKFTMTSLT